METFIAAFWNAFWVFLGVIAGSGIQYRLNKRQFQEFQQNAKEVLTTEIDLNLGEHERVVERIQYLRDRVSAGQIDLDDLFVSMQGFDYSALTPLVNSGYFYLILREDGVRKYLEFSRFFNTQNALTINSMMRTEHERGKSLDFLDWLQSRILELRSDLETLRQS